MRSKIEKVIALVRQGHNKRALHVLYQIQQQLPPDIWEEDSDADTLELALPTDAPSVTFRPVGKEQYEVVIDIEEEWVIGEVEEQSIHVLCAQLQELPYLYPEDLNTYKMSISSKLREFVLQERIKKRT